MAQTFIGAMQTQSACNVCHGAGKMIDKKPAGADQNGLKRQEEVIEIEIPAGVEEGMQLNVRGKGNAGPFNGVPGDLMVVIEEVEHAELKRDGDNVHYEAIVSFMDAVLGASVEVPTISGKAKINTTLIRQTGMYNVFPIGFNLYKKYKLTIYTTNNINENISPLVTGSSSIVVFVP